MSYPLYAGLMTGAVLAYPLAILLAFLWIIINHVPGKEREKCIPLWGCKQ